MQEFERSYPTLFHAISDAEEELMQIARRLLVMVEEMQAAQQKAEDLYIQCEPDTE